MAEHRNPAICNLLRNLYFGCGSFQTLEINQFYECMELALGGGRMLKRIFAVLAVGLWGVIAAGQAQALNVTVGGTTYNVQFLNVSTDGTFLDNIATLTNTATAPWWGNSTLALQFADAYDAADGAGGFAGSGLTGSPFWLNFVYAHSAPLVDVAQYSDGGATSLCPGCVNESSTTARFYLAYAASSTAAVPEIDANVLVQALFVLFVLGIWLTTLRRCQQDY